VNGVDSVPAAGLEAESLASDAALGRFYREALPDVYGYFLYRCGGSVSVAEDLTQETFLAAVAQLKQGLHVESPTAWIHGIARHKLIDHYRRTKRWSLRVRPADEHVELAAPAIDESQAATVAALARVPAAQRAALVLRHVDGFAVPEVAALLGRSVEAVESLLARGRVSLRRAYLEETG
jgi:RNA polymerase sigma-70 factor (ECF subfamily)